MNKTHFNYDDYIARYGAVLRVEEINKLRSEIRENEAVGTKERERLLKLTWDLIPDSAPRKVRMI
jgi:hypothetical protein